MIAAQAPIEWHSDTVQWHGPTVPAKKAPLPLRGKWRRAAKTRRLDVLECMAISMQEEHPMSTMDQSQAHAEACSIYMLSRATIVDCHVCLYSTPRKLCDQVR